MPPLPVTTYSSDPRVWLERVRTCSFLPEREMLQLCALAMSIMVEEPNVAELSAPVTVCGDIHGQFYDLMHLLDVVARPCPQQTSLLFLGDFVDRGYYSLETFTLMLILKVLFPTHVTLLRGNHESRQITQVYGFYDECMLKYASPRVWIECCNVFDTLALAAVIDDRILCVHGGLSPDLRGIDSFKTIQRAREAPNEGALCDIMWSDPEDIEGWEISPRGAGWLFGGDIAAEFLHINNLELIARAHQLVQEGYKYSFADRNVVTVWSAPNYCYRCGNIASVMEVNDAGDISETNFKRFSAVPSDERKAPGMNDIKYFL